MGRGISTSYWLSWVQLSALKRAAHEVYCQEPPRGLSEQDLSYHMNLASNACSTSAFPYTLQTFTFQVEAHPDGIINSTDPHSERLLQLVRSGDRNAGSDHRESPKYTHGAPLDKIRPRALPRKHRNVSRTMNVGEHRAFKSRLKA